MQLLIPIEQLGRQIDRSELISRGVFYSLKRITFEKAQELIAKDKTVGVSVLSAITRFLS